MPRRSTLVATGLLFAIACAARSAHAVDESDRADPAFAAPTRNRVRLIAGAGVLVPATTCAPYSSDVRECSQGGAVGALHVGSVFRIAPLLSAGVRLLWAPPSQEQGVSSQLVQGTAEARFHPFGFRSFDPWIGLHGGFATLRESYRSKAGIADAASRATAVFGGGAGFDWCPASRATFGLELRWASMNFTGNSPRLSDEIRTTQYLSRIWISVAMSVGFVL